MDPKPPSGPTSPTKDETVNSRSSDPIPSISDSTSLTQSPPVQVMERPEDFDFSSRSSSPSSEWSSASSESLFSIHHSNSYKHDQGHLAAADVEHSGQNAESLNKLDAHASDLDEPQKVVRWKTQVERLADEGVNSQSQQLESSPLTDHKSSEPKNKSCWSKCNCGSCKVPKWMRCCNCKPKKSSHSKETNSPSGSGLKKLDQKAGSKKGCCSKSCFPSKNPCSSCYCHCCLGEISV
ncbi:uncharacterized protein LOC143534792 [Bidens hawaiensis]|uniref:uncharacterized protein LOC143534792 n=1 Tax=Bidens hawaiensis TaxID=980011 RepID=UPI00404B01A3